MSNNGGHKTTLLDHLLQISQNNAKITILLSALTSNGSGQFKTLFHEIGLLMAEILKLKDFVFVFI